MVSPHLLCQCPKTPNMKEEEEDTQGNRVAVSVRSQDTRAIFSALQIPVSLTVSVQQNAFKWPYSTG